MSKVHTLISPTTLNGKDDQKTEHVSDVTSWSPEIDFDLHSSEYTPRSETLDLREYQGYYDAIRNDDAADIEVH